MFFFCTDYAVLDNLFQLRPFKETVIYHMIRAHCVRWGYCDRVLVCFLLYRLHYFG